MTLFCIDKISQNIYMADPITKKRKFLGLQALFFHYLNVKKKGLQSRNRKISKLPNA